MSLSVLIADDDDEFRNLLRRLLRNEGEVTLVGEAEDGEEALRLAQRLQPQVILMDIDMPRMNGLEATRQIKSYRPEAKVIILGIHNEEAYRRAAKECGADGFVLKKTLSGALYSALLDPQAI